jgi:hypothetical protein
LLRFYHEASEEIFFARLFFFAPFDLAAEAIQVSFLSMIFHFIELLLTRHDMIFSPPLASENRRKSCREVLQSSEIIHVSY